MIPQYLPNIYPRTPGVDVELSFFQSDGTPASVEPGVYDYFVADGNLRKQADMPGVNSASACDNAICHAGLTAGAPPQALSPLSALMISGKHTGADQVAGSNCNACHSHTDSGGSWAANNSCKTCHGQPPLDSASSASGYIFYASNADESKTPHKRHVVDYGYSCKECHFQWTSVATHNTATPTFESIWFDPARNPDAALYPSAAGYTVGTYPTGSVCNNLYCHSDGQRHQAGGSVASPGPQWMTGQQTPDWSVQNLECNACHGATTVANTLSYGAPDHANGTGGNTANSHGSHAYACAVCHNDTIKDATFADGWTLPTPLSAIPHLDGSKSLKADGATMPRTTASGWARESRRE
jgi:predicted CxxxxCH...CXXCH cytochrome family protein